MKKIGSVLFTIVKGGLVAVHVRFLLKYYISIFDGFIQFPITSVLEKERAKSMQKVPTTFGDSVHLLKYLRFRKV